VVAPSADLEFGLVWDYDQGSFDVSLRFTNASNVDQVGHPRDPLHIDPETLDELVNDEEAYAATLSGMVFGPEMIRSFYSTAKAAAQTMPVHFRLHIDGPARYHQLRWELLRDPEQDLPVATSRNVLFSRYLSSPDWRPIPTVQMHEPRALVVIANPTNLDEYRPGGRPLRPVNVAAELARVQAALVAYRPMVLARPAEAASLGGLVSRLEDGIDVVYLVAHGTLTDDVPVLFLEKDDGSADPVDARRLVEHLYGLERRPSVILLSSCQSAGAGVEPKSEDEGALAALGPRLASAGVAAVVAMQDNVTMGTASDFAPAFFRAFLEDGVVDRAMAVARRAVRDRPDWWVPVLFSRLRSGRAYHIEQFTDAEAAAETWDELRTMITTERLTPVLGPGLADEILGSREEVARRWVRRWQMPIAPYAHEDLARVGQYLRVGRTPARVTAELQQYMTTELRERGQNAQGDDPFLDLPADMVEHRPVEAYLEVGRRLRARYPGEPFRVVATLPAKVFVTSGWTGLLQQALLEQGKKPVTGWFRWTDRVAEEPRRKPEPTVGEPLVYHLFGRLDDPDSLVLTEDDYFEWLTAWIDRKKLIPSAVKAALTKNALLFLGYRLDDWDFRVVFQSIKSFAGGMRSRQHIGVQLKPENQLIEPEAAQRYLESYFGEDRVNIYWASTRAFLEELCARVELRDMHSGDATGRPASPGTGS
jgi:SIR2-like domain/CHAT domain